MIEKELIKSNEKNFKKLTDYLMALIHVNKNILIEVKRTNEKLIKLEEKIDSKFDEFIDSL